MPGTASAEEERGSWHRAMDIDGQTITVALISLLIIVTGRFLIKAVLDATYGAAVRFWTNRNSVQRAVLFLAFATPIVVWQSSESNRVALYGHLKQHLDLHGKMFFNHYLGPVIKPEDPALPLRRLLIVGEVGDGKSTMINSLRDPARSESADAGRAARGVTKEIKSYVGKPINGHPVELLDTPGVGDKDITPTKLISMLEARLLPPIDGVLVTNPIPDGRVKLGAQVVSTIVDKGFVGVEKWASVILVGTKNDRAEDEEQRRFFTEDIMREFYALAPNGTGVVVLTSKDDYSGLQAAVAALPRLAVHYKPPDATEMAFALAESFGMRMDDFQRQLREERERMRQEYNEEIDRLRLESEKRWKESDEREAQLREKLSAAEARAKEAVGAAKVVAEKNAAEMRAEFAQQEEQTRQLREDFDKKNDMWEALQARLKEFEEKEARDKEHERRLNEEIAKLQAEQAELRRQLAVLEQMAAGDMQQRGGMAGGDGGQQADQAKMSELQRQLEETEEKLAAVTHQGVSEEGSVGLGAAPDSESGEAPAAESAAATAALEPHTGEAQQRKPQQDDDEAAARRPKEEL